MVLSLTLEPEEIERSRTASRAMAFDWGVETLLSCVNDRGETFALDNPRWYQNARDEITVLERSLSRKKRGSRRRQKAARRLAEARSKLARRRDDFLHQKTASLAQENAPVATEKLNVKNMTRSARGTVEKPGKNVTQKAGLNRGILDTAPARLLQLLRYKVQETGGEWVVAPTRKLKPSQRYPNCGHVRKKSLSERVHHCDPCGYTEPRDIASVRVVLNWVLHGTPKPVGN